MKIHNKLLILTFAVLVFSTFGFSNNFALATSSGPNAPGTVTTSNTSGGTFDWNANASNVNSIKIEDGTSVYAYVGLTFFGGDECLSWDTLILTDNGTKEISDINQGDLVYSYNITSQNIELKEVIGVFNRSISFYGNKYYHIYFEGGDIKATYNHLFYVGKDLKMARDLVVGDILFDINGKEKVISNIIIEENYTDNVWDITVENNHNFFANGVLVHNVGSAYDKYVKIIKSDGSLGLTDKADGTAWGSSLAYTPPSAGYYGGDSDLWGETWTASDINDSDFGIAIAVYGGGHPTDNYITYYIKAANFGFNIPTEATINGIKVEVKKKYLEACGSGLSCAGIDYISITVYYTEASNTAPTIGTGHSDGGSSTATPTTAGNNVSFTATATDGESDNYYLAICKTNAITANNNGVPTCTGGNWCISSSTASASQANCNYTTAGKDAGSKSWYAFVCDYNASSACSSMSQGSGNNGSPFVVRKPSVFKITGASLFKFIGGLLRLRIK
ncbi:MAG: hypothetical protein A2312_04460 [Candidatus Staskawiczbacteria bacterium RIFOXYB2_FULL_32_9]|uniref:Uncharacterized protein n=1 Tax=Candidatus Staskawiczbacteria bacterium RIFOXYD1_FULL_32_13 TaxID=1802234 RepID=A0A1G2JLK9_9BACT|nr:MAG: Anaerobic ribonucleoside-triphosphate reductase [Parcubacteria group bacterium GW2011_GWC2_32_10]OGZ78470.1 MAG: hypothetical protein A2360_04195 [Candidatus Staskawiczbacteria bacterium RIFOXYB1_FULL_32_11]OGZ78795.1 MAG: hypothetical protein A2256_02370 [Candidatus Staskawiczbacteria bacterium RIFOXYA2_FULL_32_7]OGZ83766.1 MAG: hypothetical protein A2312_04460 [Candidatus Staskawiczbacteria bacterium RIFOXYB2_FULL_32_9]OGZ85853.1 MAG: hypothetical protein A2463_03165 [Candidatus Stask